jgi:hypothetical protein
MPPGAGLTWGHTATFPTRLIRFTSSASAWAWWRLPWFSRGLDATLTVRMESKFDGILLTGKARSRISIVCTVKGAPSFAGRRPADVLKRTKARCAKGRSRPPRQDKQDKQDKQGGGPSDETSARTLPH